MSKNVIYYLTNATVFIFSVIAFWMQLTELYQEPLAVASFNPADLTIVLYISITAALVILPIALLIVVETDIKERFILYAVASFLSLLFFPHNIPIALILLIGLFFAFYLFDQNTLNEIENQIHFKPHQILKRTVTGFLATVAIVVCIGYYASSKDVAHEFRLTIPDQLFNQIVKSMGNQVSSDQNSNEKVVENLFETQVKPKVIEQLTTAGITDEVSVQKYLDSARSELEAKTKTQMEINLKADNNLVTEVKKQTQDNLNAIVLKYQKLLPLIFTFSLFALFQFLDIFVSLIVSGLLILIVFLLMATGVIHKTSENKPVESLSL